VRLLMSRLRYAATCLSRPCWLRDTGRQQMHSSEVKQICTACEMGHPETETSDNELS
jgi:hypothetical protein